MGDETERVSGAVPLPRLRGLRAARFLTQEALADKAGVARFTIRRIEQGAPARYSTVQKLAAALGVEPEALTADVGEGKALAA